MLLIYSLIRLHLGLARIRGVFFLAYMRRHNVSVSLESGRYTGRDKNRNGVGVIIDKQLLEDVVEVRRRGDRILLVKLILGREIFNVISIYAPQVGLDESSKRQF